MEIVIRKPQIHNVFFLIMKIQFSCLPYREKYFVLPSIMLIYHINILKIPKYLGAKKKYKIEKVLVPTYLSMNKIPKNLNNNTNS